MTDDVIGNGSSGQEQPAISNSNVSAQQSSPVPQRANDDMISKERVNEIVHERTRDASQKAYERGLAEAEQKLKANQSSGNGSSLGGMPQMTENQLREMMVNTFKEQHDLQQEEFKRQQIQSQLDQLANDFMGKLNAAKDQYPDLAKRQDEISDFATLVPYINEMDQAAGITQHLLDNGHNVASLLVLSQVSPGALRRELKRLASTINVNQEARNRPQANSPLDTITPSTYTTDSGSGDSLDSLRGADWLRG